MTRYIVHRRAKHTERGNRWHLYRIDADQPNTTIGFFPGRSEAKACARLLASWRGQVEIINKPYEGDAWRLTQ